MLLRLVLSLVVLLIPITAVAADYSGQSRTFLQAQEASDDDMLVGLYEYLDLSVTNIGEGGVSFNAGGWGRADLADERDDGATEGDLQYAYIAARLKAADTLVRIGRFYVFEGVASEQVDGLHFSSDPGHGFTVSAYGGLAVETGAEEIYGARIAHAMSDTYRLGVSYLFEDIDGRDREEIGYDLSLFPAAKVSLQGRASYNLETDGWMDHNYRLQIKPMDGLRIIGEVSFVNYEDLFQTASLSAFAFPALNPKEELTTYGVTLEYGMTSGFGVSVDYRRHDYDISGEADYYGGALRYTLEGGEGGAGASYHRMDGETDILKYHEVRVYAFRRWEKVDLTLDAIDVIYDEERNGQESVYSVSVAAGYQFTPALNVGGDVEYQETPEFEEDLRGLLKIRYVFGEIWGGV